MKLTDVVPNLIVTDIDRSTAFYRDVLGFSVVATVPEQGPLVFVWLQRDDVSVFLNSVAGVAEDLPRLSTRPVGGTATLFLTLDAEDPAHGVDALHASVSAGTAVVMPLKNQFYGMREFAVEDPDGYVLIFAQKIG
jgi:catechol 2,3-dioxygenase-like lactoylglutathione lyase family enzyme